MQSAAVTSNQTGIHPDLERRIIKYRNTPYLRKPAQHSLKLFATLDKYRQEDGRPLILDSGCGTGDSSLKLCRDHPDHLIIGIDKSAHRLSKYLDSDDLIRNSNLILLRMELVDFWLLAKQHGWQLAKHYLFYPNPWPKKKHLQRRWHAHPVFPALLSLGGRLQLRSNWQIYQQEFARALSVMGHDAVQRSLSGDCLPCSPFEKKYQSSRHPLYETIVQL